MEEAEKKMKFAKIRSKPKINRQKNEIYDHQLKLHENWLCTLFFFVPMLSSSILTFQIIATLSDNWLNILACLIANIFFQLNFVRCGYLMSLRFQLSLRIMLFFGQQQKMRLIYILWKMPPYIWYLQTDGRLDCVSNIFVIIP